MSHRNEFGWIRNIQKGDVLRAPSGVLRVVSNVSHNGHSLGKTSVTFAIRHCSWTGRPFTVLNGNDLKTFGYRPTKAHVPLRKAIDKAIEREFSGRDGMPVLPGDARLTCCDVVGLP